MGKSSIKSLLNISEGKQKVVRLDCNIGIYHVKCSELNRVYIGQSKNVPTRLRNHKMNLRRGNYLNKTTGLSQMQVDFNRLGEDMFEFAQVLTCEPKDLYENETFYIKKHIDNGWEVYNHFLNTEVEGLICPEKFKDVVRRVILMLDKGKLTETELSESLDNIDIYR